MTRFTLKLALVRINSLGCSVSSPLLNGMLDMRKFKFIGGKEKVLDKKPFLEMDYGTVHIALTSVNVFQANVCHAD
jgi:hypothetical protein